MASITSKFQKLPLFIIGKGTNREEVEEELGEMIEDNEFIYEFRMFLSISWIFKEPISRKSNHTFNYINLLKSY